MMLPVVNKNLIFPILEHLRQEPISACLSNLQVSQWYSTLDLKQLQLKKLSMLLRHCNDHVPYYKKVFDSLSMHPEDFKSLQDLERFPYLTKEIISAEKQSILAINYNNRTENCHSGGTQGIPLNLIRDSLSSAYARGALYRCLSWYGINIGDKQLRVWGVPLDHKMSKIEQRKDFLLNRMRISAFDISNSKILYHYKTIINFRPKYIYGYVSGIYRLCRLMNEEKLDGVKLGIRFVVTTAEYLDDFQRNFIEKFLNCRVINEYGCGEIGPIAHECPSGHMHINMENVLVEFIPSDCLGEGNYDIVLTNLNSFSMPLLRYKIKDVGKPDLSFCECGRGLQIMKFESGRVVSTLVSTDGRFVAGNFFRYLASDFSKQNSGIKDFRVVQKAINKIEITLSKDKTFSQRVLNFFSEKVRDMLGKDMQIEYIFVDEIPLEKSGKRLYVYSELRSILER